MLPRPKRIVPKPGQESVWDYPRPPAIEQISGSIAVWFDGRVLCRTETCFRVLETSHPPVYYLPLSGFDESMLRVAVGSSYCEWKGMASYYDVVSGDQVAKQVGWTYAEPQPRFAALKDHIALYAGPMDRCTVNGVEVEPQPGGFYGGWITPDIVGPFKGVPGSMGW